MPLGTGQPSAFARAWFAFMVFMSASAPPAREPPSAESLYIKVATRAEPSRLEQTRSGAVMGFGRVIPIIASLQENKCTDKVEHETQRRSYTAKESICRP
jgi:hypothetical protein